MNLLRYIRTALISLSLVFVLLTNTACSGAVQATQPNTLPGIVSQLERGDTSSGQTFGDWVVQTSHGLIKDAYVRDNDKLGVVIASDVRPNEVRSLAKSLMQGFHQNFQNRDLAVLVYAPDKKLILTANYDDSTRQINYK